MNRTLIPMGSIATFALAVAIATAGTATAAEMPAFREPTATDRILVIAPHPDDGELCCSGYVQRAVAQGAQVAFVWMTPGDGFTIDALLVSPHFRESGRGMIQLGRIRLSEAFAAARSNGVPLARMSALGYPDGGLAALLGPNFDATYTSPHTRSAIIPYGESPSFGQPVNGRSLQRDLADVIARFQPTVAFAPHAADIHPDHAGTGELARRVFEQRGEPQVLFRYVIHAGAAWPAPRALRAEMPLDPPPALTGLPWQRFALTSAERDSKLRSLRFHETQWRVMAPYLESFVRGNELFVPEVR